MVGKAFKEAFEAGLGGSSFSDGSSAAGELPPTLRPTGLCGLGMEWLGTGAASWSLPPDQLIFLQNECVG